MMKKMKLSIIFVLVLLLIPVSVSAYQINSSSYRQNVIVSGGGENSSSSTYKTNIAVGIINGIISSASYINNLGFFHFLLLANNLPCTAAGQCEGGYCCSNLCKSSACPTPDSGGTSGGGGGAAAAGGGGGGGGSNVSQAQSTEQIESFRISPSAVKEHLALGASKTAKLKIENTGETALSFDLNVATINDILFLSDSSFSLEPGKEKIVELNIIGKKLGSYLGQVIIKSGGNERPVDVIIEIESENVLFDAKIDIPSAYREVEAGGDLKAQITLLNVGPPRKVDVTITYIIKGRNGNVVYESSETFAVEKQSSFVKSFRIPKELQPGDYLAIIELRYEKSFAVSSELFKVVPKGGLAAKTFAGPLTITFLIMILAGLVFLFTYLIMPKDSIINKFRRTKK